MLYFGGKMLENISRQNPKFVIYSTTINDCCTVIAISLEPQNPNRSIGAQIREFFDGVVKVLNDSIRIR